MDKYSRQTWEFLKGTAQFGLWAGGTMQRQMDRAQAASDRAKAEEDAKRAAMPPDPMEGMATAEDLQAYRKEKGGFYLGKIHPDHGANFAASSPATDDRHIFVFAGSAAGKGLTIGIQNALRWPGGLLAIDPKGEMAEITAMRRGRREDARGSGTSVRKFAGQRVAILDPMNIVRGAARKFRVTYDPVADIDMRKREAHRKIAKLASGLIVPEDGDGAHFSQSAETLLAGAIEAVKLSEPAGRHTLPHVRQVILGNVQPKSWKTSTRRDLAFPGQGHTQEPIFDESESALGFETLLNYLTQKGVPKDGHAGEAAAVLGEVLGSNEAGSFRTTLSRNLKWLADPDMRDHLKASGFSLVNAIQKGWSVFIVLKPDDIADFRNWLRMVTQISLSAKMALGTNQSGYQTLFVLDEFAALGRFKEIEDAAGYMRGYGIKLVPIIQNLGQIKNLYAKNWETFMGNAGAIIAWGLNDLESEQYIADRLGTVKTYEAGASQSTGGAGASSSWKERVIRFPNDIRAEGARETGRAFVIPASGKGFTIERVPYTVLASSQVYDAPDHIAAWEKLYRKTAP